MNVALHILAGVVAIALLALLPIAARAGLLMHYLIALPIVFLPIAAFHRLWGALRGGLFTSHFRKPLDSAARPYLLGALLRAATWVVVAAAVSFAVIPQKFTEEQFGTTRWMIWLPPLVLALLALFPNARIRPAAMLFHLALLLFSGWHLLQARSAKVAPDAVEILAPTAGEWLVMEGGNSPLINQRFHPGAQRYTIDLIHPDDALLEIRPELSDFASFGTPTLAPLAGRIVAASDILRDEPPGESNPVQPLGNHVIIEHGPGVYCLLAHLQADSVTVEIGDSVEAGDVVGACGNSGETSQPHHHLRLMSEPDPSATSSRSIPILLQCHRGLVQPRRHDRSGGAVDPPAAR